MLIYNGIDIRYFCLVFNATKFFFFFNLMAICEMGANFSSH